MVTSVLSLGVTLQVCLNVYPSCPSQPCQAGEGLRDQWRCGLSHSTTWLPIDEGLSASTSAQEAIEVEGDGTHAKYQVTLKISDCSRSTRSSRFPGATRLVLMSGIIALDFEHFTRASLELIAHPLN